MSGTHGLDFRQYLFLREVEEDKAKKNDPWAEFKERFDLSKYTATRPLLPKDNPEAAAALVGRRVRLHVALVKNPDLYGWWSIWETDVHRALNVYVQRVVIRDVFMHSPEAKRQDSVLYNRKSPYAFAEGTVVETDPTLERLVGTYGILEEPWMPVSYSPFKHADYVRRDVGLPPWWEDPEFRDTFSPLSSRGKVNDECKEKLRQALVGRGYGSEPDLGLLTHLLDELGPGCNTEKDSVCRIVIAMLQKQYPGDLPQVVKNLPRQCTSGRQRAYARAALSDEQPQSVSNLAGGVSEGRAEMGALVAESDRGKNGINSVMYVRGLQPYTKG